MIKLPSWLSTSVFGFALLCLLLPFLSVKCNGLEIASLKGYELITGTTIDPRDKIGHAYDAPGMFDSDDKPELTVDQKTIHPQWPVIAASLFAIFGLAVSLLVKLNRDKLLMGAGFGGAVLLFLQLSKTPELDQGMKMLLTIDAQAGFWLMMLALLAGGGISFWEWRKTQMPSPTPSVESPPENSSEPPPPSSV